jgi:hypothetical protein
MKRLLLFIILLLIPYQALAVDKYEVRDSSNKLVSVITTRGNITGVRDKNGRLIETIRNTNNGYETRSTDNRLRYKIRKVK